MTNQLQESSTTSVLAESKGEWMPFPLAAAMIGCTFDELDLLIARGVTRASLVNRRIYIASKCVRTIVGAREETDSPSVVRERQERILNQTANRNSQKSDSA